MPLLTYKKLLNTFRILLKYYLGGIMKREYKSRILALLLPVLMLVQILFLPKISVAAKESSPADGEKYTIRLLIDVLEKTGKSSKRTVKIWKLSKENLIEGDILKTAKHFDEIDDEDKIDAELKYKGQLSKESVLDETISKEVIEIPLVQEKGEKSYYLIKESKESLARMAKRIESGKSQKLVTNLVEIPNKNMKDGLLAISMKSEMEVPSKKITLIKTDSRNEAVRLDKVSFRLYKKVDDTGLKDELVSVEGSAGVYKYKPTADKITEAYVPVLKTNTDGKIEVSDLPEGPSYYFKEIKASGEYDNNKNANIKGEDFTVEDGKEVRVKNERIPFTKKTDDNGKALEGVVFEVYTKEGKKLNFSKDTKKYGYGYLLDEKGSPEVVTDKDGLIFLGDMKKGEGYYFLEKEAPAGYEKSSQKYEFNVDENGVIYYTQKDENGNEVKVQDFLHIINVKPKGKKEEKGGRKFVKVDADDTRVKIKGAKFKLSQKLGDKFVDVEKDGKKYVVESDENGRFEVRDLKFGTYYLKEISVPGEYVIDNSPIEFEINGSSLAEAELVITNKKGKVPPTPPTRGPRGPLVKTGDIRILVFFATGLILIASGFAIVRNQDMKVKRA